MDSTKLKEIIKMANEAVTGLDGDLKKIAFQTTLDKLLSQNMDPVSGTSKVPKKVRKIRKGKEFLRQKNFLAGCAAAGSASRYAASIEEVLKIVYGEKYRDHDLTQSIAKVPIAELEKYQKLIENEYVNNQHSLPAFWIQPEHPPDYEESKQYLVVSFCYFGKSSI